MRTGRRRALAVFALFVWKFLPRYNAALIMAAALVLWVTDVGSHLREKSRCSDINPLGANLRSPPFVPKGGNAYMPLTRLNAGAAAGCRRVIDSLSIKEGGVR